MNPESEYVRRSFTVRDLRFPSEVKLTKNALLRWYALSLGLMSADETRNTIIPVLDTFFTFQLTDGRAVTIADIADKSKQPEKSVRYHMNKLVDTGLVDCQKRRYSFKLDSFSDEINLRKSFQEHFAKEVVQTMKNAEHGIEELQRVYKKR